MSGLLFSRGAAPKTETLSSKDPVFMGTGFGADDFTLTLDILTPLAKVKAQREMREIATKMGDDALKTPEGEQQYNDTVNALMFTRHVKDWSGVFMDTEDGPLPMPCSLEYRAMVARQSPSLAAIVGAQLMRMREATVGSYIPPKKKGAGAGAGETAQDLEEGAVIVNTGVDTATEGTPTNPAEPDEVGN